MIYLDNAATSYKKPESVIEAVANALRGMGNAGRGVNEASLNASRIAYETRLMLSDMFGGYGAAQTAFTANSTESLNTAIFGTLKAGDHVITSVLEHNSVLRPLYLLQDQGLELSVTEADEKGNLIYSEFEKAIKPNTKAIISTHGSNLTGNVVDLKKLGRLAAENGLIFIVDASQTAGVLPIDMKEMNIDLLCLTGHKSLMGPQGTGALLVKEGLEVKPLKVGGSGIHTYDRYHPEEMPTRLEAGTLNMHGIAGLHAALSWINDTGISTIHQKELYLAGLFYDGIKDIDSVKFYGDYDAKIRTSVVALNIGDYDSGMVSSALLEDYDIQTRSGGHCAPLMHKSLGTTTQGVVRFSFGWFNTEEETQTAIRAVRELAD